MTRKNNLRVLKLLILQEMTHTICSKQINVKYEHLMHKNSLIENIMLFTKRDKNRTSKMDIFTLVIVMLCLIGLVLKAKGIW